MEGCVSSRGRRVGWAASPSTLVSSCSLSRSAHVRNLSHHVAESILSRDAAEPLTGIESFGTAAIRPLVPVVGAAAAAVVAAATKPRRGSPGERWQALADVIADHGEEVPPSSTSSSTSTTTSSSTSWQTRIVRRADQHILELETTVEELRQELAAARRSINNNNS